MSYALPPDVRGAVLWTIRGYYKLKARYEEILESSPAPPDGQPGARSTRSPVDDKAVRLSELSRKIDAIEKAWDGFTGQPETFIPPEYRRGIWDKIQTGAVYPRDAYVDTYKTWKQRYIHNVAVLLHWI